jgi:hypothetical protein
MRISGLSRCAFGICAAAAMLAGCGGSQPPIGAPGAMHQSLANVQAAFPSGDGGPFLYVGGHKISKYALGSSEPVRSAKRDENVTYAHLAFDRHGDLCEASGDISAEQFLTYDARTLKLLHVLNGAGAFDALVTDRLGYVYASAYRIYVYAPGCRRLVNVIHPRDDGFVRLVFDQAGNLYAQGSTAVSVFAPAEKPGHMRFVRRIRKGINNPGALAIGPSGDLFVASWGGRHSYVTEYRPGGSVPVRTITEGIEHPWILAADSQGRLYVANAPLYPPGGRSWISVYPPNATRPMRKIVDGINTPSSLGIDPSDNLYVMNEYDGDPHGHQTVTVYASGGTKLLQTITKGDYGGQTLIIGSP